MAPDIFQAGNGKAIYLRLARTNPCISHCQDVLATYQLLR